MTVLQNATSKLLGQNSAKSTSDRERAQPSCIKAIFELAAVRVLTLDFIEARARARCSCHFNRPNPSRIKYWCPILTVEDRETQGCPVELNIQPHSALCTCKLCFQLMGRDGGMNEARKVLQARSACTIQPTVVGVRSSGGANNIQKLTFMIY